MNYWNWAELEEFTFLQDKQNSWKEGIKTLKLALISVSQESLIQLFGAAAPKRSRPPSISLSSKHFPFNSLDWIQRVFASFSGKNKKKKVNIDMLVSNSEHVSSVINQYSCLLSEIWPITLWKSQRWVTYEEGKSLNLPSLFYQSTSFSDIWDSGSAYQKICSQIPTELLFLMLNWIPYNLEWYVGTHTWCLHRI